MAKKLTTPVLSRVDFAYACDEQQGWCVDCRDFVDDSVENSATEDDGYKCSDCGGVVLGAEEACASGFFIFDTEEGG